MLLRSFSTAIGLWVFTASATMAAAGLTSHTNPASIKRALTASDALETVRFLVGRADNAVLVSPHAERYAVILIRGDVAHDGVWAEILSGKLDSLETARPRLVARLFTSGLGYDQLGDGDLAALTGGAYPRNEPVWVDDQNLTLLWQDSHGTRQVLSVNVETCEVRYLTKHPTDVMRFGISSNGSIVYDAKIPFSFHRSDRLFRDGFAVTSRDATALLKGIVDGTGSHVLRRGYERFVMAAGDAAPSTVRMPQSSTPMMFYDLIIRANHFSPVSNLAIVLDPALTDRPEWARYTTQYQRGLGGDDVQQRFLSQLFVLDLNSKTMRPLWDAPTDLGGVRLLEWSPDGMSVLLGPTFLPALKSDSAGLSGRAFAEVELRSGQHRQIPVPPEDASRVASAQWISPDQIEISLTTGTPLRFRKRGEEWSITRQRSLERDNSPSPGGPSAYINVELRQSMSSPPAIYAYDTATSREQAILSPNHSLETTFDIGKVQSLQWTDTSGREWRGRLYHPISYQPERIYPLVIQTNSLAAEGAFSIYGGGPDLGPGWGAGYMAQVLAGRGIAVLHGAEPVDKRSWAGLSQLDRAKQRMLAYEAGAEELVNRALVDRDRVGIMGFSNRGWVVEYILTHSDFPFAAAIAADHKNGGYFEAGIWNWTAGLSEDLNGAPPFDDGLQAWLQQSPAFNAHRVRTPLQLQLTNSFAGLAGLVSNGWEMFSRLRHLQKPVEFYVVPNFSRGTHNLQNPSQLMAVQQRALDWWCFWLKGEEDADPYKMSQYRYWRTLRQMHAARSLPPRDGTPYSSSGY